MHLILLLLPVEKFFSKIPSSQEDEIFTVRLHSSCLHRLYKDFGGEVRKKDYHQLRPVTYVTEIVDGITYRGGPIDQKSRATILTHAKAALPDLMINKGDLKRQPDKAALLEQGDAKKRVKNTSAASRKKRAKAKVCCIDYFLI